MSWSHDELPEGKVGQTSATHEWLHDNACENCQLFDGHDCKVHREDACCERMSDPTGPTGPRYPENMYGNGETGPTEATAPHGQECGDWVDYKEAARSPTGPHHQRWELDDCGDCIFLTKDNLCANAGRCQGIITYGDDYPDNWATKENLQHHFLSEKSMKEYAEEINKLNGRIVICPDCGRRFNLYDTGKKVREEQEDE